MPPETMTAPPEAPPRDHALDGMRVFATLLVITIHASAKGFGLMGERNWWAVNVYESVARVSVPLFFMISGVLLLPRVHTIASIGRRTWRIALPLLAWSVLYLLWFRHAGEHHHGWLATIVDGPVAGHLWYLYALAGVYVFLPVLAAFHQTIPLRVQLFCLLFWFIAASLVPLEIALTGRRVVGVDWAALPLYPGYMAIGALLYRHVPAVPRRAAIAGAWAAWFLLAVGIALATWWRSHILAHADEAFYVYSSPLVVLAAIPAFVCLRALCAAAVRPGSRVHRAVGFFANLSFGIYLSHVWVLLALDAWYGIDYRFANPWIAIPLLVLLAMALSALLVRALQALPVVRAIVPR
jgi:surface polysaccharide O-acyltransferase-like enzyme